MRVLLKYKKSDAAIYISHLDLQRAMQRALRRSRLPVKYTMGFHPHPVMTFALPLPVAVSSRGDYMEFRMQEFMDPVQIKAALNAVMPEGLYALDCGCLPPETPSLMSLVRMCAWEIVPDGVSRAQLSGYVAKVLRPESLWVTKKDKNKERQVDIRPGVYLLEVPDGGETVLKASLQSGSRNNISPKMLLKGMGVDPRYAKTERVDIYFEKNGIHFPMINLCR